MSDRPPYTREEMDNRISDIMDHLPEGNDRDLLGEILGSVLRLAYDQPARLDMKIVNNALREMRHSFRMFAPHRDRRKISVFGSARTPVGTPLYLKAEETARQAVEQGMMIITGAGGGVMEAANKGAGLEGGFGLGIRLPFEPEANRFVRRPDRLINFKYFFTRKLAFVKESDAFILFPGGFGTNDEAFELLTLLQTGKGDPCPVVLLDVPGGTYWDTWIDFCRRELVEPGYIDPADLDLLTLARSPEDALREIRSFYHVYHSSRYAGDRLMLRLARQLTDGELRTLAGEFSDLLQPGTLEPCSVLDEDRKDPILRLLHPIRFRFDRRRFSRLRQLIDRINRL